MESPTGTSDLVLLEQAELAARERRLAASSEAERIVATAREQASDTARQAGQRASEALAELRRQVEADAARAIASLERDATARLDARAPTAHIEAAMAEAVDLIVKTVLGESRGGGR